MPQIQVLQRQGAETQQPDIVAQTQKNRELLTDLQYKQGLLSYNKEMIKLQARNATTEEEKLKYEQLAKSAAIADTMFKNLVKSSTDAKTGYINKDLWQKNVGPYFTQMMDIDPKAAQIFTMLAKNQPQIGDTESMKDMNQARYLGASADILASQNPTQSAQVNALGGQAPSGGMVMQGLTASPSGVTMDMVNPQVKAALLTKEVMARKAGERNVALQDFNNSLSAFKEINAQVKRGSGILGRSAAAVSNEWAAANQNTPYGNVIATYKGAVKSLIPTVARLKDVGNLSQPEQDAAKELIPSLYDSDGAAQLKLAYLESISQQITPDMSEEEGGAILKKAMAQMIRDPRYKTLIQNKSSGSRMPSSSTGSRFTIKVKGE